MSVRSFSDQQLFDGVRARDLRAVSRLITLSENREPRARGVLSKLYQFTGNAQVVGVTGSPGAGKSTLVDQLAALACTQGRNVAILAIDPTSPFSGGAVLGDRIRMSKVAEHPQVYIRSMATRGALGGISHATVDTVRILDAAGFDLIFVETVGVGQAEVDIIKTADTCLVVLVPGMGDSVQAIKAGILEIADLFVINKADRDGADLLQKDIRVLISLAEYSKSDWEPPILRTIATEGSGAAELLQAICEHAKWLTSSQAGANRKFRMMKESILNMVAEELYLRAQSAGALTIDSQVLECIEKKVDPFTVVQKIIDSCVKL